MGKTVVHMISSKLVRAEHTKACKELDALMRKGKKAGCDGPLPEDVDQYFELSTIKETLE